MRINTFMAGFLTGILLFAIVMIAIFEIFSLGIFFAILFYIFIIYWNIKTDEEQGATTK